VAASPVGETLHSGLASAKRLSDQPGEATYAVLPTCPYPGECAVLELEDAGLSFS
jgi:hypothetical protein